MEFSVTGTEEVRQLDAGLILTSIGYRGKPIRDLPFDEAAAVVPNEGGRVVPGAYVAGWIKRGPTGFIGTNKSCSLQTVQALVADFNAGKLTDPVDKPAALTKLVYARQPDAVDSAGWRAIDAAESCARHRRGPAAQQVHRCRRHAGGRGHRAGAAAAAPAA